MLPCRNAFRNFCGPSTATLLRLVRPKKIVGLITKDLEDAQGANIIVASDAGGALSSGLDDRRNVCIK
jgi:hypothetical protein